MKRKIQYIHGTKKNERTDWRKIKRVDPDTKGKTIHGLIMKSIPKRIFSFVKDNPQLEDYNDNTLAVIFSSLTMGANNTKNKANYYLYPYKDTFITRKEYIRRTHSIQSNCVKCNKSIDIDISIKNISDKEMLLCEECRRYFPKGKHIKSINYITKIAQIMEDMKCAIADQMQERSEILKEYINERKYLDFAD